VIALVPNKVKRCAPNILIKNKFLFCLEKYSFDIFRVTMCHAWHTCHVLTPLAYHNHRPFLHVFSQCCSEARKLQRNHPWKINLRQISPLTKYYAMKEFEGLGYK
jgi:hypothetical protein